MRPSEVLDASRQALRDLERLREERAIRTSLVGVQGHSYGVHDHSGILDPSRKVVDLMAWQEDNPEGDLARAIEDAREMIQGVRVLTDDLTANVLFAFYCEGRSWEQIARDPAMCRGALAPYPPSRRADYLKQAAMLQVERIDAMGIARIKAMARTCDD